MDFQTRKMMEEFHHQPPTMLHDHANIPHEPGSSEPQPKSGLVGGVQSTTGPTSTNASSTMPHRNCFVRAAVAESALVAGKRFFTVSQTRKMIDKFHHEPQDLPNESANININPSGRRSQFGQVFVVKQRISTKDSIPLSPQAE